jgi:hypothetical protein
MLSGILFFFRTYVLPWLICCPSAYLGLPTRTQRELLASPLIRNDITTLLTAGEDRNETRRLRDDLKDAIRKGAPCSLYCGVKIPGKKLLVCVSPFIITLTHIITRNSQEVTVVGTSLE